MNQLFHKRMRDGSIITELPPPVDGRLDCWCPTDPMLLDNGKREDGRLAPLFSLYKLQALQR